MADPIVWGTLPKAQDDAQTITEAIAAAIAVHNDDPTAHMDTGQSIDVHRVNGMIDHPAGSVASDKLPQKRFVATVFESLTGWAPYKTGTGNYYLNFPGVVFQTGVTSGGLAMMLTGGDGFSNFDAAKDFFFKTTVRLLTNASQVAWWGLGADFLGDGYSGCGFKVLNGSLYAYYNDNTAVTTTAITGITFTDAHVYEIRYTAASHTFIFYVDGVQVASMTHTFGTPVDDSLFTFGIQSSASGAHNLYVADVVAELSVI